MIKKEVGYDPQNNDWYFEGRNPEGVVQVAGNGENVAMCQSCHGLSKETDFLPGTRVTDAAD